MKFKDLINSLSEKSNEEGKIETTQKYASQTPGQHPVVFDTDIQYDGEKIAKALDPTGSINQQVGKALSRQDKDVDGDVDSEDGKVPDETAGSKTDTLALLKKGAKERSHTKKGNAYESIDPKKKVVSEAFINSREYASHGLMHPNHAKEEIHKVVRGAPHHIDFYAHGTGDKISGRVVKNDGKEVHIQADRSDGGKLHKFKVQIGLPKSQNEGVAESLKEGAAQHKVLVMVSDPNHTAVTKRKEQVMKKVIVNADDKNHAVVKATEFYKKKGYKVHAAEYHSPQPKSSMKTESVEEAFADQGSGTTGQSREDKRIAKLLQKKHKQQTPVKEQDVAEGSLTDKQQSYWDSVAKEKKNKERAALNAKKVEHEKTPIGKAEKYWGKKGVAEEVEESIDLNELSKDTLKSYTKQAVGDFQKQSMKSNDNAKQQALNRYKGIHKAVDKLAKEDVDLEEASEDKTLARLKQLVRFGLMDKSKLPLLVRAMNNLEKGQVTNPTERSTLFELLNELIGLITGDDAMYARVRMNVQREGVELEEKKTDYTIHHDSYSSAVQHAVDHTNKNSGFTVDTDHYDRSVAMGPRKPSEGKTNSFNLTLTDKNGKESKKKLHMQVYGMGNGKYELNKYVS